MRRYFIALVLALMSGPAAADIWSECNNGPNVVMTQCIWDRYEAVDAELNAAWKEILAKFDTMDYMKPEDVAAWKGKLVAAQRAWITFKDDDCNGAVAYEWFGGSGANAAIGACLYGHTRARVDDLRSRYLENR